MVQESIEKLLESGGPWTFKPLFELIDDSAFNKSYIPESLEKYLKLTAESQDQNVLFSVFSIKAYHSAIISLQFKTIQKIKEMECNCVTNKKQSINLFELKIFWYKFTGVSK